MKDNKLAKDLDFLMSLPVSSASKNPASPVENTAGERIREFLRQSEGMLGIDKEFIITRNHASLLASDLRQVLNAEQDLYDALKELRRCMRQSIKGKESADAWRKAAAAIAKAEGRS